MDRQVKKMLTQDIIVYGYSGITDGDKSYADPITLKGFCIPKYQVITDRMGARVEVNTSIILDVTDMAKISYKDEVETPFIDRLPVKSIVPHINLKNPALYELIEVFI